MARLISRQEAGRVLDVSEQTVSNWLQKGVIKGHLIENRLYVDRETIEQYLDGLQDLAHLENSVKEKTKYLREEDFNLQFEIDDPLKLVIELKTAHVAIIVGFRNMPQCLHMDCLQDNRRLYSIR
jgi:hypothetical protein